jgi:hypothetical protein
MIPIIARVTPVIVMLQPVVQPSTFEVSPYSESWPARTAERGRAASMNHRIRAPQFGSGRALASHHPARSIYASR